MVRLGLSTVSVVALGFASLSTASPLQKRIAQVITDATHDWEQACLNAGGGQKCNPISIQAFSTLLAGPGPCEQQDAADAMIDLAHTLGSNTEMIRLTQLFVQQPRNSPDSVSVLYCQKAPRNAELNGLFQCQFAGVNPKVFTGSLAVGAPGTIPFGLKAPLSPPGSCKASKKPVPNGQQLEKIVSDPGVGNTISTAAAAPVAKAKLASETAVKSQAAPASKATAAAAPSSNAKSFALKNGQDAQALNANFAKFTTSSACTAGEDACVNGGFAQCVSGKFVLLGCGAGTTCVAAPLVDSAGTSIVCTTPAEALARIQATGAKGGLTG